MDYYAGVHSENESVGQKKKKNSDKIFNIVAVVGEKRK